LGPPAPTQEEQLARAVKEGRAVRLPARIPKPSEAPAPSPFNRMQSSAPGAAPSAMPNQTAPTREALEDAIIASGKDRAFAATRAKQLIEASEGKPGYMGAERRTAQTHIDNYMGPERRSASPAPVTSPAPSSSPNVVYTTRTGAPRTPRAEAPVTGERPTDTEAFLTNLVKKPVWTPEDMADARNAFGPDGAMRPGEGLTQYRARLMGMIRSSRAARQMVDIESYPAPQGKR
jgi:hypothetical protein